ncbi:hypothetical protein HETIRDRAFT_162457 [Heterobasidion irregulare TC 32-1]|uniref:Uncharacterized protein n=1 Tax=Heterobasidion irregulare (strain TC 32-1) TaxID=747525 RepID=W4JRI6_HETIT|nr:uncharacterized protein HETIRDRAFT_162457 [Heterobasidion irregulare TC 32-1]ETW75695.1 hypothetical protein HETIRDRAFT_162457 [Heterobasidion irregulare TC 32-1]
MDIRAGVVFVLLSVRGQVNEVQLDHYHTLYSNRRDTHTSVPIRLRCPRPWRLVDSILC